MILVTGATGFLGSELIHQLTGQGKSVRALKREQSAIPVLLKDNTRIEWFVADINDLSALDDAFEGITKVYHCAAIVSFDPKDKAALLKVNIEGTSNVANLCVHHNARLLHVSSVAALGEPKKGKQITEKDFGSMMRMCILMQSPNTKEKWKSGAAWPKAWMPSSLTPQ
ncbi:NAD-dependent epimerase/dehydratase family protein [Pedobacter sp. NJ-S-72]